MAAAAAAVTLAAAGGPLAVQLGFAVVAVGIVGMAHGASDLAVVAPSRRPRFLALYGIVSLACLVWWTLAPGVAMPAFLIASAVHFGIEDAPPYAPVERIARGIGLIAAPAALHGADYAYILGLAGAPAAVLPDAVPGLRAAGGIAVFVLLAIAVRRRDDPLALGTLALAVLPPLVGFSVGFLILHALPQTDTRRRMLGCATIAAYLRAVAPVLLAAFVLAAGVAAAFLSHDASGIRPLFAAIAALAVPHLLVTPWFEGETTPGLPRGPGVPSLTR